MQFKCHCSVTNVVHVFYIDSVVSPSSGGPAEIQVASEKSYEIET